MAAPPNNVVVMTRTELDLERAAQALLLLLMPRGTAVHNAAQNSESQAGVPGSTGKRGRGKKPRTM